jgi:hypothetical protein
MQACGTRPSAASKGQGKSRMPRNALCTADQLSPTSCGPLTSQHQEQAFTPPCAVCSVDQGPRPTHCGADPSTAPEVEQGWQIPRQLSGALAMHASRRRTHSTLPSLSALCPFTQTACQRGCALQDERPCLAVLWLMPCAFVEVPFR